MYFRFMDDVMFSHHGANRLESSTTLCLEEVRQVAVTVGRQRSQCLVEFIKAWH